MRRIKAFMLSVQAVASLKQTLIHHVLCASPGNEVQRKRHPQFSLDLVRDNALRDADFGYTTC